MKHPVACLWAVGKEGAATYHLIHDQRTMDDARILCQLEGGDLATLPSIPLQKKVLEGVLKVLTKISRFEVSPKVWTAERAYQYCYAPGFTNDAVWKNESCGGLKLPFPLCERRIAQTLCTTSNDCDPNATCQDNYSYVQVDTQQNVLDKICTCNMGFYGNGSVCFETL